MIKKIYMLRNETLLGGLSPEHNKKIRLYDILFEVS